VPEQNAIIRTICRAIARDAAQKIGLSAENRRSLTASRDLVHAARTFAVGTTLAE
jgi:hypothetical protein